MKLETKFQDENFDFGEIVKAKVTTYYDENKVVVMADRARGGISRFEYNSIKDFTDNWEDAPEEPKEYWYIESDGSIIQNHKPTYINHLLDGLKSVGNYFETREEAEKAVEKLKAWKRLEDKGFRFCGVTETSLGMDCIRFEIGEDSYEEQSTRDSELNKDLRLLFGGEE